MRYITISQLIEFSRSSQRRQRNFADKYFNHDIEQKKSTSKGGGNYWIRSLSAIRNSFFESDSTLIDDKINEINLIYGDTASKITKIMYDRNLDILYNYQEEDFSELKPSTDLVYLKKPKKPSISINGLRLKVNIDHLFSYEDQGTLKLGAIWFVAKLGGYEKSELGVFNEALYSFLNEKYSDEYSIDPDFVWVMDVEGKAVVNHKMLTRGEVNSLIDKTTNELRQLK